MPEPRMGGAEMFELTRKYPELQPLYDDWMEAEQSWRAAIINHLNTAEVIGNFQDPEFANLKEIENQKFELFFQRAKELKSSPPSS